MVVNLHERTDLKDRLDMMFSFASQVAYTEEHLLPVIQASKSLIGMSIDKPPRRMLKWLEHYMKKFKPNYRMPSVKKHTAQPELLSTFQLEELILENKKNESIQYLHQLLQVSDPRHIMELILEISLHRSNKEVLFCWYALKSVLFMDPKESINILFLCLDCLFSGNVDMDDTKEGINKFYLLCHSYQMNRIEMVRSNKIGLLVKEKRNSIIDQKIISSILPKSLIQSFEGKKENGLKQYLTNLAMNEIDAEHLLLLDALRAYIRYSNNTDEIFQFIMNTC